MRDEKCKICRRLGVKLFLKGERCLSSKCPMVKRPYPPGQKGKRRKGPPSEFGKESREKQKLKILYNLGEKQFKNYVKKVLERKGKVGDLSTFLIKILESRLDSVVFILCFSKSRAQAKQLVSHNFFLVNEKPVNLPSYQLKKGDVIRIRPQKAIPAGWVQNLKNLLKKYKTPSWFELDVEKLEGKIIGEPKLEEVAPPVEIPAIFEYYSR
jgi:small subunit ribosomal protein S4